MGTENKAGLPEEAAPKKEPCPVCGEPISPIALKCIYCGEFLEMYRKPTRSRWPKWAGFEDKTCWDWVSLLFIPLFLGSVLAVIGYFSNETQNTRQNNRDDANRAVQRTVEADRIAAQSTVETDRAQEAALQSYLDKMTDLLLSQDSLTDEQHLRARAIAQSRTLTLLRGLDTERKEAVVTFLVEANSLSHLSSDGTIFIPLLGVNLSGVDLSWFHLSGAILNGADLTGVNLSYAFLKEAYLGGADLTGADLKRAQLQSVDLVAANLSGADLRETLLTGANLNAASLRGANLTGAFLREANLTGANLTGANLTGANLTGANLRGANLHEAYYNDETTWPGGFDPETAGAIFVDEEQ